MPQNIVLAAFLLGAVLLLLSLSSGGFKVFGAEMSGASGRGPRLVAGLAGAVLISFGLWQSIRTGPLAKPDSPKPDSPVIASAPTGSASAQPTPTSKAQAALPAGLVSDNDDGVQILDVSPPPGSYLQRGTPHVFNMKVAYSLHSTDVAILSMSVAQIRESQAGCAGKEGQLTDATQVEIKRGNQTVDIALKWSGDSDEATKNHVDMKGYLRFVPMFWRSEGGGRGERIRTFEGYEGVCMRFGS